MAAKSYGFKILRNGKHVGNAQFFGASQKKAESNARRYANSIGAGFIGSKSPKRNLSEKVFKPGRRRSKKKRVRRAS